MNAAFAIGRLCDMDTGRQRLLAAGLREDGQSGIVLVSQALCWSVRHLVTPSRSAHLSTAPCQSLWWYQQVNQHCPTSVIMVVPAGDSVLPHLSHCGGTSR